MTNATQVYMHPDLHVAFGVLLLSCIVFGILCNGACLAIFIKNKELRSPTNTFVISLCFCDLMMGLLGTPLAAVSSLYKHWLFGRSGCVFEGFIVYFFGLTSLLNLCAISIDRYIVICKPGLAAKITKRAALLAVVCCYGFGFFWACLPLVGWNKYELEGAHTSCSVVWSTQNPVFYSYNITIFVVVFMVPLMTIMYCYFHIYLTVRSVSRNTVWDTQSRVARKNLRIEKKMAKTIVLMVGVYLIAWSPYAIVSFWAAFGDASSLPTVVATAPAFLAKSSTIWNPMIYIATNKQFRCAFYRLVPCESIRDKLVKKEEERPESSKESDLDGPTAATGATSKKNAMKVKPIAVDETTDQATEAAVIDDMTTQRSGRNSIREETEMVDMDP